MAQRYLDTVAGSDSNSGNSVGQAWATVGKVYASATVGDTVDIVGSSSEASPRDIPFGVDVFFNDGKRNNMTFRNYGDTHIRLSAMGRGQRSGFAWERWTAGGILVQGGGSIRLGPIDQNDPNADGNWRFGVLQLTGSSGMMFDGGPNKKLFLNGGGADQAIYMINHSSAGCGDITIRNWEGTADAAAILIRSNGTNVSPGLGGLITIEDFIDHDHNRLLDNRGIGDVGAHTIMAEFHNGGIIVQRGKMWNNWAPSTQYGWDGGAVIPFGSANMTIRDCEMWDCAGYIESGRATNKSYCDNLKIYNNVFHGRTNPFNKNPPTDPCLLLRDFRDGLVANNTFYHANAANDDYYIIALYVETGQFAGIIDRGKILNNVFVMLHDNARGLFQAANLPTGGNAVTVDYNLYYRPNGGTIIGNGNAGNATWAQWPGMLASAGVLGAESHGKNVNPLLTNPGSDIYTLQAGSPAIDAGVVIPGYTDGYLGSAPDLGAFEYVSSNQTYAHPGLAAGTGTAHVASVRRGQAGLRIIMG